MQNAIPFKAILWRGCFCDGEISLIACALETGEKNVEAAQQEQVQNGVQASAAWSCC